MREKRAEDDDPRNGLPFLLGAVGSPALNEGELTITPFDGGNFGPFPAWFAVSFFAIVFILKCYADLLPRKLIFDCCGEEFECLASLCIE
jgi:hypothetical protein